jgi:hypothetical protein
MAITTSTQICNLALDRIGEAPITLITDDNTTANLCERHYEHTVTHLLMSHRWNFATKRTILEPTQVTPTAVDDNTTFQIEKTSHGLTTGQRVTISSSTNYPTIEGTWRVTRTNADSFDLDDSDFSGSGAVDFTYALAGYYDWDYSIALPSDCLRALEDDREETNIDVAWIIEAGQVLTDQSELEFKYIYSVTDVSDFTPTFIEALILTLAIKFKVALQGANADVRALASELLSVTGPLARRVDANESQRRTRLFPSQSYFIAARGVGA